MKNYIKKLNDAGKAGGYDLLMGAAIIAVIVIGFYAATMWGFHQQDISSIYRP